MGGAETLVKNYLLAMNAPHVDMEAFVLSGRCGSQWEHELEQRGIKVTYLEELRSRYRWLPRIVRRILRLNSRTRAIKNYLKGTRPDVIHCHLTVARELIRAKEYLKGIRLFYTVHNEPDSYWANGREEDEQQAIRTLIAENGLAFFALHEANVPRIRHYFGNKCSVRILNNGVDVGACKFSHEKREKIRREWKIPADAYVIGHVGRIVPVKNHDYMVEVFQEVRKRNPRALLCFAGAGELLDEVKEKVASCGLTEFVLFLGIRGDVSDILSAFDVFLFPSLWEGFPLTLIEAQAAGLPCVIADTITPKVRLSDSVTMLSLDAGVAVWADAVNRNTARFCPTEQLAEYDIHNVMQRLLTTYEGDPRS